MRLKILSMVVMTSLMLCKFLYAAEFKKPSNSELKKKLSKEQFEVTQKNGTEPPFKNAYWDNHEDGIYVDIVSGEPLFSSLDKYDSKTGWPSFTRPLVRENLIEKEDRSLFSLRTKVRSKLADSHLGHVFDDGPAPTGKRYCMNSAALRFIPKAELQAKGYGEYLKLFAKASETTTAKAIFAGGCFWCMEAPFDQVPGVISVTVGYTGGTTTNPTYAQVSAGQTGHLEAVEIIYQRDKVSFLDLVNIFWRQVDPFQGDGQFCDHGPQYQAAIFVESDQEKAIAEETKTEIAKKFNRPVATLVRPKSTFYPAEDYHQHYYKMNPIRYKYYRTGCGRDAQLNRIWK